jgi:Flp pilus assembly protein TadD
VRGVSALCLSVLVASSASLLAGSPDDLTRAESLLERKDYAAAESLLREVVRTDPRNARAHGNLALALLPQHKVGEAVTEARLAAAFEPASAQAHFIFGMALAADRKPLDAIREYERAVELSNGAVGPVSALAPAYAAVEDPRTAATYEKLAVLRPADPSVPAHLAEYLWRTEKVEDGNAVMERALVTFPENADLRVRWGRSLAQQDRYADAAEALEGARRLGADDAETLALLADVDERAGRVEDARATLAAAVARHPQDPVLAHALGRLRLAEGKTEDALPQLEKAALARPKAADYQLDYGRCLEASGRVADAEAAYRKAIALSTNLPAAHFALGRLLQREGRKDEAERELETHHALYERARRQVSAADVRDAETALAWTLLREGEAEKALERFRAIRETPESLRGEAAALQRLGRPADAVRALERAHELAPDDARIALLLAAGRSRATESR